MKQQFAKNVVQFFYRRGKSIKGHLSVISVFYLRISVKILRVTYPLEPSGVLRYNFPHDLCVPEKFFMDIAKCAQLTVKNYVTRIKIGTLQMSNGLMRILSTKIVFCTSRKNMANSVSPLIQDR